MPFTKTFVRLLKLVAFSLTGWLKGGPVFTYPRVCEPDKAEIYTIDTAWHAIYENICPPPQTDCVFPHGVD